MTQLDLFSLEPKPQKQGENSALDIIKTSTKIVNKEAGNPSKDLNNDTVASSINEKADEETPKSIEPEIKHLQVITPEERTGDIIFENKNITVKIKARQAPEKITTNKENKGTGLSALPDKPLKVEPRKSIVTRQPKTEFSNALREKLESVKNNIKEGLLKDTQAEKKKEKKAAKPPQKRGRKSFKEIYSDEDLIDVPEDEILFKKQYYSISEVAGWFKVNTSLLRFWENEFDILKPRKNRKGDRMFRPEDVKNLQLIYELLRHRKYSIEGAKEYLKVNKNKADVQMQLTQTLQKFKNFLLELKAGI